jgi:AcrR family transcriptional regulator
MTTRKSVAAPSGAAANSAKTPATPPKPRKRAPASAPAPEPEAKPYHHGNLRESLLEAADIVLARQGASGITLREVAKEAGVSHAAPYHHFASLDDMLAAVAERGFMRLIEAMASAPEAPDARERLLQISEAYVNCARANPAQFRLMFGPLLARKRDYPALQVAAERAFGCVLAAATAHDPENGAELALVGWSLAHGLSNLLIDGALDGLPMQLPAATVLARQLAQRAMGT